MAKITNQQHPIRVGVIGAGAVSDYHPVPGLAIDPRAELVAVCDASPEMVEQRKSDWGVDFGTTSYEEVCSHSEIDAVIIATPDFTHRPMSLAAVDSGKHVMCEKPLGLNAGELREMYHAGRDASVVHMTAFTYRFAPSMRYIAHFVLASHQERRWIEIPKEPR